MVDLYKQFNRYEPEVKPAVDIIRSRLEDRQVLCDEMHKMLAGWPSKEQAEIQELITKQHNNFRSMKFDLYKIKTRQQVRDFLKANPWIDIRTYGEDKEMSVADGANLEDCYARSSS